MPQAAAHLRTVEPETRPAKRKTRRRAEMDDNKRSFLRMVSHELRTPLNSIIGFSEILAGELYGPLGAPQYREYAEHVRQSGHKLLRLVNQILEIARLDGHVTDLDLVGESIDHAIDDVLDSLREDISVRLVQVVREGEGRLPLVRADPRGLRTVLTNLVQNAVTFSPPGGAITISARRVGAGLVEIRITDQGEGVNETDIPRLLRPFEQGDNTLARPSEGVGLGLPVAQLFCKAMGGTLELSSPRGEGVTALVRLAAA